MGWWMAIRYLLKKFPNVDGDSTMLTVFKAH